MEGLFPLDSDFVYMEINGSEMTNTRLAKTVSVHCPFLENVTTMMLPNERLAQMIQAYVEKIWGLY